MINTCMDEFEIEFIRKDGSERVIKPRVRLGTPVKKSALENLKGNQVGTKSELSRNQVEKKSWGHNINRQHNLLLYDVEKKRPFEIKIALLMSFNKMLVRWSNEK